MKKIVIGLAAWLTLGFYVTYVRHPASEVKAGPVAAVTQGNLEAEWATEGPAICDQMNQLPGTREENVTVALSHLQEQDPVIIAFVRQHLTDCPPK